MSLLPRISSKQCLFVSISDAKFELLQRAANGTAQPEDRPRAEGRRPSEAIVAPPASAGGRRAAGHPRQDERRERRPHGHPVQGHRPRRAEVARHQDGVPPGGAGRRPGRRGRLCGGLLRLGRELPAFRGGARGAGQRLLRTGGKDLGPLEF